MNIGRWDLKIHMDTIILGEKGKLPPKKGTSIHIKCRNPSSCGKLKVSIRRGMGVQPRLEQENGGNIQIPVN